MQKPTGSETKPEPIQISDNSYLVITTVKDAGNIASFFERGKLIGTSNPDAEELTELIRALDKPERVH